MHDTSRSVSASEPGFVPADLLNTSTVREDVDALVRLFKVLGDGTRMGILMILADGERNVGTLCDMLDLPQPTVSHHLSLMRINRLIDNRRDGKQVFYTLADEVALQDGKVLRIRVGNQSVDLNFSG